MATYAIGDVQGCLDPLRRLLDTVRFDPAADRLWLTGDLVNRGPDSLGVLRFVRALGGAAQTVLGNHDLHLVARAHGYGRAHRSDTLDAVLAASDRAVLIDWLRHRPLLVREKGWLMVHAGLLPAWTLDEAAERAGEAEAVLRSEGLEAFLDVMYGNTPAAWDDALAGLDRIRVIVNAFTRLRYCTAAGEMDFAHKGAPGSQPAGLIPWFDVPGRASREATVVIGHWSTLGLIDRPDLVALDTGCLWGGTLTAMRLEDRQVFRVGCPQMKKPG